MRWRPCQGPTQYVVPLIQTGAICLSQWQAVLVPGSHCAVCLSQRALELWGFMVDHNELTTHHHSSTEAHTLIHSSIRDTPLCFERYLSRFPPTYHSGRVILLPNIFPCTLPDPLPTSFSFDFTISLEQSCYGRSNSDLCSANLPAEPPN
jgi:hypothetical protein